MSQYQEGSIQIRIKDFDFTILKNFESYLGINMNKTVRYSETDKDENDLLVLFKICNKVSWEDYTPATRWEPAEGGYFEGLLDQDQIEEITYDILYQAGCVCDIDLQYDDMKVEEYDVEDEDALQSKYGEDC